jgi:hypothetical protein
VRARDARVQLVHRQAAVVLLLARGHRDDLLREHVERVARHDRRLDRALAHPLGEHRALEQVGAELREDAALADVADVVAGAADPLQPGGDRLRRLDLQHEVDGAHVDPQLQARGRDDAGDLARLQLLLDDEPLLARERAVMGARDLGRLAVLLPRKLVEPERQPLCAAAVVDEDDGGAVGLDELQQLRVHRRPDRTARGLAARERIHLGRRRRLGLDHRLDRHVDLQVERLAHAGVDDAAGAVGTDHEAADLLERVLRRGEADALHVALGTDERVQPLEREREVRAALRAGDRVDLVHDRPLHAAQHVARAAREHEVERLGRRDQHVGRLAQHLLALALRRVAGADRDADVGTDPLQRRAQVALDVVGEGLERRDVDEAGAALRTRVSPSGRRKRRPAVDVTREPVQPPQERRKRLSRAGRRRDQDVLAGRDRGPGLGLGLGRCGERTGEPVAYARREGGERVRRHRLRRA